MLIKCNIAIACEKKDAICKCASMAGQSLDMEARCGSSTEHSWTAGGLACSEVDCLAAPTKTGSFVICLEACL